MNNNNSSIFRKTIGIFITAFLLVSPLPASSAQPSAPDVATDTPCRFGITSVLGSEGYDIASLGVGSYLDWGAVNNPGLPEGIEYIRVLRLRDDLYPQTLANLPGWVEANPGGVWVVGNEPDTIYDYQDALLAEVYADRYYELARIIRHLDPTAQIGFGPIVQPTAIRIRYLQRAWDRLVEDAGGIVAASKLVDIWAIHSFILNEDTSFLNHWGTGVPPGFENDHADAFIITLPDQIAYTYSIDIFQSRIIAFRAWMANIGEVNKPLWITEYGSLFPPVDPIGGPDYYNVTDEDTSNYMEQTFDFMLNASDPQSGLPADGHQLVQRWYWYSLNDHRYHYGGSLYNPDTPDYGGPITLVGQDFIDYQAAHLVQPDLYPQALSIIPISDNDEHTLVNYRLEITVDNHNFTDATCARLWVYDGDPNADGTFIAGPIPASAFHADYGAARVAVPWLGVPPHVEHTLYVYVEPVGMTDSNIDDNLAHFIVNTDLPTSTIMPIVLR
jgi:hypothetical protein